MAVKQQQNPTNTAKIQGETYREDDYTFENQDEDFQPTEEDHQTWSALWDMVMIPALKQHVAKDYLKGHDILDLDPDRIPTAEYLNSKLTSRTGWRVLRTKIRYSKPLPWYEKFAKQIFLITDFIRSPDELEFTPEPDLLHDVLGHLPWMTHSYYADFEGMLAAPYLAATDEERDLISQIAWYGPPEFGLCIEDGTIKIVGAGLISSRSETASTIEEIHRLEDEDVIDFSGDILEQLYERYDERKSEVHDLIEEINRLHEQGKMSSPEDGWNSMQAVYNETNVDRSGLLGGDEVAFLPFDLEIVKHVPKTVFAKNPFLFVFQSFEDLKQELQDFTRPILERRTRKQNRKLPQLLSHLNNVPDSFNPDHERFNGVDEEYDNLQQQVIDQYMTLKDLFNNRPSLARTVRDDARLHVFSDHLPENFEADQEGKFR